MIAAIGTARRGDVRCALLTGLTLIGCTPIYDNQYDDRANELEEFRCEFLAEEEQTKLITSGQDRVFWVAIKRPDDIPVMHSEIPGNTASRVDYPFQVSQSQTDLDDYHFSSQMVVDCDSGLSFDVASGTSIGTTSNGFSNCAVDNRTVFYLVGNESLRRWDPPAATVDDFLIFADVGITAELSAFAVEGNLMVAVDQTGDLYTVDLAARTSKWQRNDEKVVGSVFFDQRGVIYESQDGLRYIEFSDAADPKDASFADMVADGGYHLNFKHGDIQKPAGTSEAVIHDRHIIYRGESGIFAYGLDTHNVIDLLLDRGEGIDLETAYHVPVVTSGGQLFVIGNNSFGINVTGPVYQVDLTGRLR